MRYSSASWLFFEPVDPMYFRTIHLWKETWPMLLVRPRRQFLFVCWSCLRMKASSKTNRSSSLSWTSVTHGRERSWGATRELLSPSQTSQVKEHTTFHIHHTQSKHWRQRFHLSRDNILFYLEPSVMMFKKGTQNFSTLDPTYTIPVVRTRNPDSPATVKWRTKKAQRFDLSGLLKFGPGETEKNIVIEPKTHPGLIEPETFQLELFEPSSNASIGERKSTLVNVADEGKTQCREIKWKWFLVVWFQILHDERRKL